MNGSVQFTTEQSECPPAVPAPPYGFAGDDTFHKMAFVVLDQGPIVLESSAPSEKRFSSFQLMDDRNVNYAFWSLTAYDTKRGGFFNPNDEDRYHINDTTAVRNDDGTVTFSFKQECGSSDVNCLEVPAGRFDVTARYYLPHEPIIEGRWKLPGIELRGE